MLARKVVHTVTGADSYWSMLRKSHLKNYTKSLAVSGLCVASMLRPLTYSKR
jgi:hypothetical protein